MTLVLPFLLWGLGFLFSRDMGCGVPLASQRATAYTLSGLGGWVVYLFVRRPSYVPPVVSLLGGVNLVLLNPTRTPWPFPKILTIGLVVSVLSVLLVGLGSRLLMGEGKGALPFGAHPLSDGEVEGR